MSRSLRSLCFLLSILALAACDDGGGGGGGNDDTAGDTAGDTVAPPDTTADTDATSDTGDTGDTADTGSDTSAIAPFIESLTVDPLPIARNGTATATAVVTDPDSTELAWDWSVTGDFGVAPGADGTATVTAPDAALATGTLTLTVTDPEGGSHTASVELSTSDNAAPIITAFDATPPGPYAPGASIALQVEASDPDGDTLGYAWSVDDPAWTLSDNGAEATLVAPNALDATVTVTVVVDDGLGGMTSDTLVLATEGCADPSQIDCDGDASNGCEAPDSGLGPACAAASCLAARNANTLAADGVYWLEAGAQPLEAWCDMTTDGGGWVLLGTISGADADAWAERFGPWSDGSTLGTAAQPWLDTKSPLWNTLDLSGHALMLQRRYDDVVRAQTVLENSCLKGQQTLAQLFTIYDTSVACPPSAMHVLHSDPTGLSSATFEEGSGEGLGSPGTNGLCWGTEDTAVNTFSGHLGWNEDPAATSCALGTHVGGIGVFASSGAQLDNADITGTSWLVGTDTTKTAISIFAREPLTVAGSATLADPGRWNNYTFARSCAEYVDPPGDWRASGSTALGDGIYLIDVDGQSGPLLATPVFCDMTTDGGGWTAIVANGEVALAETLDPADCYPLVTNDPAAGCGDPANILDDFTLAGDLQAGLVWRQMLGISYGDTGYADKLAYFGIDFGTAAATLPERNAGTPYDPPGLTTTHGIIACTNTPDLRIVHYGRAGTHNPRPGFLADLRGTIFGHDSAASMADTGRRTLGFTDRSDHAGDGSTSSVYGLDDYQDGWSCGDAWTPLAIRGARLMLLVR